MWVNACTWHLFVSGCVHVHICVCRGWFVQSNPDYTHLPVSHFRRKGGEGWGRKRVREEGEEGCSATTANTLQMNNRVRSVIPPQAAAALAGRRLKQHRSENN